MPGHNWPAPSFAPDPYDYIENPPTPTQRRVIEQPCSYRFYQESAVSKLVYENPDAPVIDPMHEVLFNDLRVGNFESSRVVIVNDGPGDIAFSYDGIVDEGMLYASESIVQDERRERRIFLRLTAPAALTAVRIFAW